MTSFRISVLVQSRHFSAISPTLPAQTRKCKLRLPASAAYQTKQCEVPDHEGYDISISGFEL